ncbi:plakophilin-3 [Neolamprologus brichardi]|uniref:plakophilin-3 n=1 Tax=Neolamprologus brichardi TaxID=32507 RepID=UPI001643D764|nr:plakophilin-3 [Neolamprologus brichardi]
MGPPVQFFTKQTDFSSFKYSPSKANGTFHRSKSTMSTGTMKETSRTLSTRNSGGRYMSTSGVWEEKIGASTWPKSPNGIKPSKSDPALAPPFSPATGPGMRIKGQMAQGQSTFQTRTNRHSVSSVTNGNAISSQSRWMPSTQSQNEGKMGTIKMESKSMMNIQDLTLKEAVEFLGSSEERYQQWGATFIQHTTYTDESAKSEVRATQKITAHAYRETRTCSPSTGSDAVSQILVSKSRDLRQFGPLLKPSNPKLQNTALSLLGNMSRTGSLQGTMAKQILPQLGELLQGGPSQLGNSDESIAAACNTVVRLMSANTDTSKKVINNAVIQSLIDLSEDKKLTKGSSAASLLLYSIWQDKNLQSAVKKVN